MEEEAAVGKISLLSALFMDLVVLTSSLVGSIVCCFCVANSVGLLLNIALELVDEFELSSSTDTTEVVELLRPDTDLDLFFDGGEMDEGIDDELLGLLENVPCPNSGGLSRIEEDIAELVLRETSGLLTVLLKAELFEL